MRAATLAQGADKAKLLNSPRRERAGLVRHVLWVVLTMFTLMFSDMRTGHAQTPVQRPRRNSRLPQKPTTPDLTLQSGSSVVGYEEHLDFAWEGPVDCPDTDFVREMLDEKLSEIQLSGPVKVQVLVKKVDDLFHAHISTVLSGNARVRELSDSDCRSLARAITLVLAMAIQAPSETRATLPSRPCRRGTEGCPCTQLQGCESGLSCVSEVCVRGGDAPVDQGSKPPVSGDGDAPPRPESTQEIMRSTESVAVPRSIVHIELVGPGRKRRVLLERVFGHDIELLSAGPLAPDAQPVRHLRTYRLCVAPCGQSIDTPQGAYFVITSDPRWAWRTRRTSVFTLAPEAQDVTLEVRAGGSEWVAGAILLGILAGGASAGSAISFGRAPNSVGASLLATGVVSLGLAIWMAVEARPRVNVRTR